jgi:hypothetical protein
MRRLTFALAICALVFLSGCHSHYIQATITNGSGAEVDVVQVDYPSASFGVQTLAPGQNFHYRFKLLGSGNIKLGFLDAHKAEHHVTGPWLNEGQEGTLRIIISSQEHAEFQPSLKP